MASGDTYTQRRGDSVDQRANIISLDFDGLLGIEHRGRRFWQAMCHLGFWSFILRRFSDIKSGKSAEPSSRARHHLLTDLSTLRLMTQWVAFIQAESKLTHSRG